MKEDSLYAQPIENIAEFTFDAAVADVFPDMIQRSVPGYGAIIAATGLLAGRHALPDSVCYDLGCSLGAAAVSMRRAIIQPNCRIIAVDKSVAMLERARKIITAERGRVDIDLVCADIRDIEIRHASVVVLNFTLQFLAPADRYSFLSKIYRGLLPGGILIVSEKHSFNDRRQQELHAEMHEAFKKAQGYSELEISQKRTALENVLIPETLEQHKQRFQAIGFSSVEVWFQYFNFASMLALK